ncbi:spore coat protein [Clostridium merdae]|uniref:spore coat protein n=1 Tax=Clostridium merdae TaxID=1958780 RepID=UPI000A2707C5|nr:spore coat protein [Clostridium merdae]
MASLTTKELSAIEDQLSGEKLLITKLKAYSKGCTDPQLKQQYNDLACKHQQHYDKLLGFLS